MSSGSERVCGLPYVAEGSSVSIRCTKYSHKREGVCSSIPAASAPVGYRTLLRAVRSLYGARSTATNVKEYVVISSSERACGLPYVAEGSSVSIRCTKYSHKREGVCSSIPAASAPVGYRTLLRAVRSLYGVRSTAINVKVYVVVFQQRARLWVTYSSSERACGLPYVAEGSSVSIRCTKYSHKREGVCSSIPAASAPVGYRTLLRAVRSLYGVRSTAINVKVYVVVFQQQSACGLPYVAEGSSVSIRCTKYSHKREGVCSSIPAARACGLPYVAEAVRSVTVHEVQPQT
ncbi:hypothetical protein J6590_012518 [Homalodisca vitripennis]|nr:hypothetical protein J6590_012518 [Homalodisca vitripennis]